MTDRLNILPDPAFEKLKPALRERLTRMLADLDAGLFAALLHPLSQDVIQRGFAEAGAHEGTVWLVDAAAENLVPAYNTGPRSAEIIGKFKQPLNSGLVCMVFASEQPFMENEVFKNARQSKALDSLLQIETFAMIAVPFCLLGECRGVVSCVQLQRPAAAGSTPPGFRPENLAGIQRMTTLISQLMEFHLLCRAIGWTPG